ncbi:ribosome recycling factor [Bernardetia sp.]|uniref:ribosome recycling factor n=1 Tax=Bernardetia sp. TaxID=1937974 RepID=UPI0025B87BC8|nr:ribosome recycling factor [Bernardetia sp.]
MQEEIDMYLEDAKEQMEKAIKHTISEFSKIRAGKPTASMFDSIMVDYYGTQTPLAQVANISIPDVKTVVIKPWEKNMVAEITRAIRESNLGFNPMGEADLVRINVPALSGERRQELVKQAKNEAEEGKIGVRNARKTTNNALRSIEGVSEDLVKGAEHKVQALTDDYTKKIDDLLQKKEKDITTV